MSKPNTHPGLAATVVTLMLGCGGGGDPTTGPPPPPPPTSVLTTVSVDPDVTVFSTPPGDTFTLSVTLKDQNGSSFTGASSKSFSSGNSAVATVSDNGTITGVTVGNAQVTVTVQAGSVSRTATATVTVLAPSSTVEVTSPAVGFNPGVAHVAAGGMVTWTLGTAVNGIVHNVTFTTGGAPANVPNSSGGEQVSRLFPTPGSFAYGCTLHAGMNGMVHVH